MSVFVLAFTRGKKDLLSMIKNNNKNFGFEI